MKKYVEIGQNTLVKLFGSSFTIYNKIYIHVIKYSPNPNFYQDGSEKIMVKRVKRFFSIHSY